MNAVAEHLHIPAGERLLHMNINPALKAKIRAIARAENRTLSNLIETILFEYSEWYDEKNKNKR